MFLSNSKVQIATQPDNLTANNLLQASCLRWICGKNFEAAILVILEILRYVIMSQKYKFVSQEMSIQTVNKCWLVKTIWNQNNCIT